MGRLDGKVGLITGAGSGIGRAAALAMAREGAKVVVADVNADGGGQTVAMITKAGGQAMFAACDVTKAAQAEALVAKVVSAYGRLDLAFNNAGIEGKSAPITECAEENFDRIIATNLKGVFLCLKYELPQMIKQKRGVIVNTASVAGLHASGSMPVYGASKAAVAHLTRTAAREYAQHGIRINALCPGGTDTPMMDRIAQDQARGKQAVGSIHPLGRLGKPEELANAVIWLMSDEASFVTGHIQIVDGGFMA